MTYADIRNRELEHIKDALKDDREFKKRINKMYNDSSQDIQRLIDADIQRFADSQGVSMTEARKMISKTDVETFQSTAKKYVEEKNFSPQANRELRKYNVTMRTNRLELLQARINLETIALAEAEGKATTQRITEALMAEYTRQAGILGESVPSQSMLQRIAKSVTLADVNGATFSDRIWANQNELRDSINQTIQRSLLRGNHPRNSAAEIKRNIRDDVRNKRHAANRIAVTETARAQSIAMNEALNDSGFDEYVYIAEITACEVCAELDDKVFKVKDMQIGVNAPPLHPHCRCATSAHVSDEDVEEIDNSINPETIQELSDGIINHEDILSREQQEIELADEIESLRQQANASSNKAERRRLLDELEDMYDDEEISVDEYNTRLNEIKERFKRNKSDTDNRQRVLNMQKELAQLQERNARENAESVKKMLGEHRQMGIGNVDLSGHITNPRSRASKVLTDAYDFYPTDWVERSVNAGAIETVSKKRGYYSHSQKGNSTLALSQKVEGEKNNFRTAIHELAHRQEYLNPAIVEAEKAFYEHRTKGEQLQRLSDVVPGANYSSKEVTRVDDFISPYMGKDYGKDTYELLTMGMDTLYTRPQDLAKDPEMFNWVVEMLLTK